MTPLADVFRDGQPGSLAHESLSRDRGAAGFACLVHLFCTGKACSHDQAHQVVDPVPCGSENHEGDKEYQHVDLGKAHVGETCPQLIGVERSFDATEKPQIIEGKTDAHGDHGETDAPQPPAEINPVGLFTY